MNASIVRWTKTHTVFTLFLGLTLVLSFIFWRSIMHSVAQTSPACSSNYVLGVSGGGSSGGQLSSSVGVLFSAPVSATGVSATRVDFWSNSVGFLGGAVRTNSLANVTTWSMPLTTQLLPNGQQIITANVRLSDGGACTSQSYTAQINNSQGSQLNIESNPQAFNGPINSIVNFNSIVRVVQSSFDVTPYAEMSWTTTIGQIERQSVPGTARMFTGPSGGNGTVTVTAKYAGKTITKSIPISIAGGGLNTSGIQQTATVAQTVPSKEPALLSTAEQQSRLTTSVQDCSINILGAERTAEIKNAVTRPSSAELVKLKSCFAQTNFVLPSVFAPVDPTKIKELSTDTNLKISDLSNVTTKTKKQALKLSGVGKPNTTVIIYVFSEPLVITTATDDQGNWAYTLEDPLVPGNHEVYALVDSGNATYTKTDPFTFVIGAVAASPENPSGLSLNLVGDITPIKTQTNTRLYLIVLGVTVTILALFIAWLTHRWKTNNNLFNSSSFTGTHV